MKPSIHAPDTEIYKGGGYGSFIYLCYDCSAYVGCHKTRPTEALGRLANKELRDAKIKAHFYFDHLWQRKIATGVKKGHARAKAYKWLSEALNISPEYCHIGMMDIEDCQKVIDLCKPYHESNKTTTQTTTL